MGFVCGLQLYSKREEGQRSFFRAHEATLAEPEGIILQAVEMEANMGYGGDDRRFVERVRAFAKEEGPGVMDQVTGLIQGVIADRSHDDKVGVDQILEFDLKGAAIPAFFKQRGVSSFDKTGLERIADRVEP